MDFMLEFRFEFLWPCWLLMKSSFDFFRYQGLGLTILFLLITLFSDVLFFIFLPVQWLFFVASTYVWVQFVCNTDRGPCVTTVSLWLIFVYVEASVRLRDVVTVPFHLDLCRPFAAHCIGYPVVRLGYGFKIYIGFKLKSMRQKEVSKQNTFYHQLVSYALPTEIQDYSKQQRKTSSMLANGINTKADIGALLMSNDSRKGPKLADIDERHNNSALSLLDLAVVANDSNNKESNKKNEGNSDQSEGRYTKSSSNNQKGGKGGGNNDSHVQSTKRSKNNKKNEVSDEELDISESEESTSSSLLSENSSPKSGRNSKFDNLQLKFKEEQSLRRKTELQVSLLESEVKKLRHDLSSSRQSESDTRTLVNASLITERHLKEELQQLRTDKENMQTKVNSLTTLKSQDKTLIRSLETKLKTEKEGRLSAESQLKESKKRSSKVEEESLASPRSDCHETCASRIQELEFEMTALQTKFDEQSQGITELNKENTELKKRSSENEREKMKKDVDYLTSALNLMQTKNLHLESSLSSETRLKLDLFSALGDTRRQLEIVQSERSAKCTEVDLLKAKIAEVMAVMPPQYHSSLQSFVSQPECSTYLNANPVDTIATSTGYSQSIAK